MNAEIFQILPANDATMLEVEAWLDREDTIYKNAHAGWVANRFEGDIPDRGFRCNWDRVVEGWRASGEPVHVLIANEEAVGFLAAYDILEVRPDQRGKGFGRGLAEFMMKRAELEGRSVLEIDIAPSSAEPFWKGMGFTTVEGRVGNGGGQYAYKLIPRVIDLGDGQRASYAVSFYTERQRYADGGQPFVTYSGQCERLDNGSLQLHERAYCFRPEDEGHHDYFVRIEVDGEEVFFDKTKREEAKAIGIELDPGYVHFIERIARS